MNYLQAFAISASGMSAEKARVDVTAVNLANAQSTRLADGTAFQPLRVVSVPKSGPEFGSLLGTEVVSIRALAAPPRLVYEPGHPEADEKGFVSYPGINPVSEMITLLTATRAYEANVAALNAAKTIALRALELAA